MPSGPRCAAPNRLLPAGCAVAETDRVGLRKTWPTRTQPCSTGAARASRERALARIVVTSSCLVEMVITYCGPPSPNPIPLVWPPPVAKRWLRQNMRPARAMRGATRGRMPDILSLTPSPPSAAVFRPRSRELCLQFGNSGMPGTEGSNDLSRPSCVE